MIFPRSAASGSAKAPLPLGNVGYLWLALFTIVLALAGAACSGGDESSSDAAANPDSGGAERSQPSETDQPNQNGDTSEGQQADEPSSDGSGSSSEGPLAFGTVVALNSDWHVTIVGLEDAEELLDIYSDPAPSGFTQVAVTMELTYVGSDYIKLREVEAEAGGDQEFDDQRLCGVDPMLRAQTRLYTAGQTSPHTICLRLPTDQLPDVVFVVSDWGADETATFSSSSTATQPAPSLPNITVASSGEPGSPSNPVPFGTVLEAGEWSVTVESVEDATPYQDGSGSEPPAGFEDVLVTYEVTYNGIESQERSGTRLDAVGSAVFYELNSGCSLDVDLVPRVFFYDPGQTGKLSTCLTVPTAELDDLYWVANRSRTDMMVFVDE